ncbi:MBG domain-containing protein, partial [Pedobacter sp. P351]|uniref:MBG domain-containing protein n=1 Tax=Pedobacter superstes TaxID=3133441 RepID=UPI0030B52097
LSQTYDGTARSATATTTPAGLTGISFTYDGSPTAPTNAGSYAVVASLSNANYAADDATGNLVIGKATASLSLASLSQTYDGTARSATATTNPAGLTGISITYDGSSTAPSNAGSYAVVASLTNDNYQADNAIGTLILAKASASIVLASLSHTYNGSAKSATAATTPAGLSGVSISYAGSATAPTNAGTYAVVASLTNNNYQADNATGNLVIGKAAASMVLANLSQTYDGTARSASATTTPAGLAGVSISYDGSTTAPVNASSYAVIASLNNQNYQADNATGNLVISKAPSVVNMSDILATYNGSEHAAAAIATGAGGLNTSNNIIYSNVGTGATTYTASATAPILVGSYSVTATYMGDANHTGSSASATVIINKRAITITAHPKTKVYGQANPVLTGILTGVVSSDAITPSYNTSATQASEVAAAGYPINASLNDPNNKLSNYTLTNTSAVLTIIKANATITVIPYNGTYDGQPHTASGTARGVNDEDLSSNLYLGSAYTNVPGGSSTWTFTGGTNYNDASGTTILTIMPQTANPMADAYYTGSEFYWTASSTNKTATLTLAATIKNSENFTGDIRTAKVSFFIKNGLTLTPITGAQNLPVDLINPSDLSVGSAATNVQYNLGSASATTLTIAVRISGNYNALTTAQYDALLTIAVPTPGGIIAGGAKLPQTSSSGFVQGASDRRSDISFYVQYNKSLKNPQGNVELIIRSYNDRDGNTGTILRTYKVKSTAISVLAVTSPKAEFTSKGNIAEIVNGVEESIEGNLTFQLKIYDAHATGATSQLGSADQVAVTIYRSKGGIWYSNNWNGTQTNLGSLFSGVLSVSGNGGSASTLIAGTSKMSMIKQTDEMQIFVIPKANLTSYPNPYKENATIAFSVPQDEDYKMDIYDMKGSLIKSLAGGRAKANSRIEVNIDGNSTPAGIYILRLTTKSGVQTLRMIHE